METTLTTTPNGLPLDLGTNVKTAVQAFAISQDVKPSSRALYSRTLDNFFQWVATSGRTVANLTVADLIAYKEELLAGGKSSLTVASYVNSIRRFYEWAEGNKIYPNIAKTVHAPKRVQAFRKQPLTVAQVGELLHHEQGTQSVRDFAIINLMVRTGLRCIEVVRANVGDITYKGGQRVLMVQGKGRDEKDKFVILTDACYNPIREYLDTRTVTDDNAPLFASVSRNNDGGRLTTRTVSGIAKQGLKSVGLDNKAFTAHSLRHTTAVNILRAGGTLQQAQGTLRHEKITTTQIYTGVFEEEQRLTNNGETLLDNLYNAVGH